MMKKSRSFFLFIVIAFLLSCSDNNINQSAIHLSGNEEFIVEHIDHREDGRILVHGNNRSKDQYVIKIYDRNLNIIDEKFPQQRNEFQGQLKGIMLNNGNWFFVKVEDNPLGNVGLFVTDEDFNISSSRYEKTDTSYVDLPDIYSLEELKNGDLWLIRDSSDKIVFCRYTTDLKPLFKITPLQEPHQEKYVSSTSMSTFSPYSIEQATGNITISYVRDESINYYYDTASNPYATELVDSIHLGEINPQGELVYSKSHSIQVAHALCIGMGIKDDYVLLGTVFNDEHLLRYYSFDLDDFSQIDHIQLENNFINHQVNSINNPFHFNLGIGNPFPKHLKSGQGHFLYARDKEELIHLSINQELDIKEEFTLQLPLMDEVLSYRQVYTDQNTIIVGVSYIYQGKNFFDLKEVNLEGDVVN